MIGRKRGERSIGLLRLPEPTFVIGFDEMDPVSVVGGSDRSLGTVSFVIEAAAVECDKTQ